MWRDLVALAVLAALFVAALMTLPRGTEGALTAQREEFLRTRIGYLEDQVRMERLRCTQERAERAVDEIRFTVFGKRAEVVNACDPRRYGSVMPCVMREYDWRELSKRWRFDNDGDAARAAVEVGR